MSKLEKLSNLGIALVGIAYLYIGFILKNENERLLCNMIFFIGALTFLLIKLAACYAKLFLCVLVLSWATFHAIIIATTNIDIFFSFVFFCIGLFSIFPVQVVVLGDGLRRKGWRIFGVLCYIFACVLTILFYLILECEWILFTTIGLFVVYLGLSCMLQWCEKHKVLFDK